MARLLGPDANGRFVYVAAAGTLRSAVGLTATVYAASTGSTLADIASYDGTATPGATISGSTLTVDTDSLLPRFWFPDGADTVYISANGGTRVAVNADYDARLDLTVTAVNVKAYGATGDGVTDDTAAIGSAWTALTTAGSGVLYFPAGNYLTTGIVLRNGSNFVVKGDRGAVLWTSRGTVAAPTQATHNVLTVADCTDFTITGLEVDGRRDVIAADQYMPGSYTANSGQNTVRVSDATKYVVGEMVSVSGGLTVNGATEKDFSDPFHYITAINTGTNTLTLDANLTHTYTGTGASGGGYVTRYQTGDSSRYTAAGRTLGNEDAQNGIHLLSCQRFQVLGCVARNVWESPIKCGTGISTTTTTATTDGCTDGVIASNVCTHGYDQGVSVWVSQRISVVGNVCNDAGWGGVVFTHSTDCTATGNVCVNNSYSPPGDTSAGSGIAVEGGERVTIVGNVCSGNRSNGIRLNRSPVFLGSTTTSGPISAGATSFTVGSASFMRAGSAHALIDASDPTKRENFTVASVVGTTVTVTSALRNGYASGSSVAPRYNFDVTLAGNVCSRNVLNAGISVQHCIGVTIIDNDCSDNGVGVDTFGTAGIYVNNECHGAAVTGNTCSRNSQEGIFLDACIGLTVQNNVCTGAGIAGTVKHGIKGLGLRDGAIVGNRVERNSGDGICLEAGSIGNTARMTIGKNVCRYNGHRGIFTDNGTSNGLTIEGNVCCFNSEPGIHLGGTSNSTIMGNVCSNNSQEGIRFDDWSGNACTKNLIIGNTLFDDRGGSATQNWGVRELGTTASNTVAYNRLYGNTNAAQLSLAGTSTSTGNIVS
jgi:parallel beta-helix repeat protein